jgi:DNA-binding TFAR19-related protein (PDSD5 family)
MYTQEEKQKSHKKAHQQQSNTIKQLTTPQAFERATQIATLNTQ